MAKRLTTMDIVEQSVNCLKIFIPSQGMRSNHVQQETEIKELLLWS